MPNVVQILIEAQDRASQALRQAEGSLKAFASEAEKAGRSMALLGAPFALVGFGAVKMAGEFEQTRISFTTLLGSAEKAKAMLEDLADFAQRTPFQLRDLEQATKRLLAYGFAAEQIIPTLRVVGDTAAALGLGSEGIDRITRALGQMQAKGRVAGQEMLQLAEAGIPAWQILADAIGVTVPEAMTLAEQGAIDASQAIAALIAGLGTRFGGLMQQQSKTFLGQMSNIKDQLDLMLRDLGKPLLDALQMVLNVARPFLEWLKNWAQENPRLAAGVVLAGTAVAALGAGLVALGMVLPGLLVGLKAAKAVIGLFNASLLTNPIFLVIAAIAALIAVGILLWRNWDMVKAKAALLWEFLQGGFAAIEAFAVKWGPRFASLLVAPIVLLVKGWTEGIERLLSLLARLPLVGEVFEGVRQKVQAFNEELTKRTFLAGFGGLADDVREVGDAFSESFAALKLGLIAPAVQITPADLAPATDALGQVAAASSLAGVQVRKAMESGGDAVKDLTLQFAEAAKRLEVFQALGASREALEALKEMAATAGRMAAAFATLGEVDLTEFWLTQARALEAQMQVMAKSLEIPRDLVKEAAQAVSTLEEAFARASRKAVVFGELGNIERQLAAWREMERLARQVADTWAEAGETLKAMAAEEQADAWKRIADETERQLDALRKQEQIIRGGPFAGLTMTQMRELTGGPFANLPREVGRLFRETVPGMPVLFGPAPIERVGPALVGLQHGVERFRGGMAIVGERGPELVRLPAGASVIPSHRLLGEGASGKSTTIRRGGDIHVGTVVINAGSTDNPQELARRFMEEVGRLARDKEQLRDS